MNRSAEAGIYFRSLFSLNCASLLGNALFIIPMQLGAREGGAKARWFADKQALIQATVGTNDESLMKSLSWDDVRELLA